MGRVDRTGIFRCSPIETGVGKTSKKGWPVFNIQVKLLEYWDEDEGVWHPWEECEQEVRAFAVLFGENKKSGKTMATLTHTQVSKVFNWDGTDFSYLNDTDFSDLKFQVRVEDNDPEYANKNPYVVNWIDEYDAVPGNKIKKLDAAGVKALNQQFAMLLKATSKKAAPVKASAVPKVPGTVTKKDRKQTDAAKTKTPPKTPPAALAAPAAPAAPGLPEGKCTKQEAWTTIVDLKNDDCDDEQLNAAWHAAVAATAPKTDDKDVTPEQWFNIREAVLNDVGKF